MKYNYSKILNVILILICLFLLTLIFTDIQKRNKVVATVGDEKISQKELNESLQKSYQNTTLNELINNSLINQQFKKEKLKITEKDELEQLEYIKMMDSKKKTLTDLETKNFVDQYLKVKFLSENLGIIKDNDLKTFLDEQKKENGDKIIKIREISGSHEQLIKLEEKVNTPELFDKFITDNNLKVKNNTIFSLYNDYDIDFSDKKVGDYDHIMDGNSMFLIVIDKVEDANSDILNLDKNKSTIINVYFSKNYNSIKVRLLNELKKLYIVKK
ncbi:hypothetical protein ACTGUM_10260 [Streptococcus suis]